MPPIRLRGEGGGPAAQRGYKRYSIIYACSHPFTYSYTKFGTYAGMEIFFLRVDRSLTQRVVGPAAAHRLRLSTINKV